MAQFISVARAPKSKEGYASIGGGSPLRQITDAQAFFYFLLIFKSAVFSLYLEFIIHLIFKFVLFFSHIPISVIGKWRALIHWNATDQIRG